MEKDVQNIGIVNYLLTILTGKNKKISTINKRDWTKDSKNNSEIISGDFIITIGRKAVILTENQDNRRVPIITKKWKRTRNHEFDNFMKSMAGMAGSSFKSITFIDSDGLKWKYYKSGTREEGVTLHDRDGKVKYEMKIE